MTPKYTSYDHQPPFNVASLHFCIPLLLVFVTFYSLLNFQLYALVTFALRLRPVGTGPRIGESGIKLISVIVALFMHLFCLVCRQRPASRRGRSIGCLHDQTSYAVAATTCARSWKRCDTAMTTKSCTATSSRTVCCWPPRRTRRRSRSAASAWPCDCRATSSLTAVRRPLAGRPGLPGSSSSGGTTQGLQEAGMQETGAAGDRGCRRQGCRRQGCRRRGCRRQGCRRRGCRRRGCRRRGLQEAGAVGGGSYRRQGVQEAGAAGGRGCRRRELWEAGLQEAGAVGDRAAEGGAAGGGAVGGGGCRRRGL